MIQCFDKGVFLNKGQLSATAALSAEQARENTMAWQILQAHNISRRSGAAAGAL